MSEQFDPESPASPSITLPSERRQMPPLAAKKTRFLTWFIDYLALVVMVYLLVSLVMLLGGREAVEKLSNIPGLILSITVTLLFYVTQEPLTGKAVGKVIMGTRVLDDTGRRPVFSRIVLRRFCRFIPFEQFSFLFGQGRGWHDSFSATYVVSSRG